MPCPGVSEPCPKLQPVKVRQINAHCLTFLRNHFGLGSRRISKPHYFPGKQKFTMRCHKIQGLKLYKLKSRHALPSFQKRRIIFKVYLNAIQVVSYKFNYSYCSGFGLKTFCIKDDNQNDVHIVLLLNTKYIFSQQKGNKNIVIKV